MEGRCDGKVLRCGCGAGAGERHQRRAGTVTVAAVLQCSTVPVPMTRSLTIQYSTYGCIVATFI
jgi:hypothetical protein